MNFEGNGKKGSDHLILPDNSLKAVSFVSARMDRLIPTDFEDHPDLIRRSRLLIRFGFLGGSFGLAYALFYFLISHIPGASIISLCSLVFATLPFVLKGTGNLLLAGNLYTATLTAGFSGLCVVEGGMHGHAVAWLSCIPLFALLITTRDNAFKWSVVAVSIALVFGVCHLIGIRFPETFDPKWLPAVDVAGYAGLVPFMALLGMIFENTRRRAFEQLEEAVGELKKANDRLTRLNQEKNEFLNIAAHDLKNPLGVVSGFADLMKGFRDLKKEDYQTFAGEISNAATRMFDIVTNLLDVRAIEDGKMTFDVKECSVEELLKRVVNDFRDMGGRKNMGIVFDLEEDLPSIACDKGAMSQILDNLVSNAIKYSPHGSIVRIEAKVEGENCRLEIIDKGPGLSEEDQAKLFGKFQRLSPQPTGGESSNGLGLWIVDRMARSMGGEVYCRSKLGEGSTFGIKVPLWEDDLVLSEPQIARGGKSFLNESDSSEPIDGLMR
ncbi:MAG: hypothetical protein CMO55_13145 [Verrucomicrobiales bacterium]|nr:hypothetical protein [Verrucomicrobiales bacterium]